MQTKMDWRETLERPCPRLGLAPTVAALLSIFILGWFPVVDPDFFWHVKTGEVIRTLGRIPEADPFSHTAGNQHFMVQGWLYDVVLEWVWRRFEVPGIRLLVASSCVGTWLVVYRTIRLYTDRADFAALLSCLSLAMMASALSPRPTTIATNFGVAVTLYALLGYRRTGNWRYLLPLPVLCLVWPNLHFGYVIGIVLGGLFLLSDLADRVMPLKGVGGEVGSLLRLPAGIIACLSLLALGGNPMGLGVLIETWALTRESAMTSIAEWNSPDFRTLGAAPLAAAIFSFIAARSVAPGLRSWLDLLVPCAFIALALGSVRNGPFAAIVLTPFIARAIASCPESPWSWHLPRWLSIAHGGGTKDLGAGVSTAVNILIIGAALAIVVLWSGTVSQIRHKQGAAILPFGAADFIVTHQLRGRLFNTYNGGGYLLYRLYPFQKVFIDGRYTPYPPAVRDDSFAIMNGQRGWQSLLAKYGTDIVVCETASPLGQLMPAHAPFKAVYVDEYFAVYVRDDPQYSHLPAVAGRHSLASGS